jgi:hypothetical protein
MTALTATVGDGHTVLFRNVSIDLRPTRHADRLKTFRGEFQVPEGSDYYFTDTPCQVKCSDGRSGEIRIRSMRLPVDVPARIEFVTTSPLI